VLNAYLTVAEAEGIPIFITRDWHPQHTVHFAKYGGVWPEHCLQGTHGAEFHKDLRVPKSARIVTKGDNTRDDGYSAFQGHLDDGTMLADALRTAHNTRVFVGGLATDYCVKQTVLSARQAHVAAVYLRDACRPVEVNPGDGIRAEEEMLAAGARAIALAQFAPRRV
jgi:nicotinamidase/pyrazinamidase